MKNIEIIIKYLSGEMQPEESEKFMEETSVNAELRLELESVSLIWKEIRDQLTLKDGPESLDRETLIAEILAEHDIQFYKQEAESEQEPAPESEKELEFIKKLEEVMKEVPGTVSGKRKINQRVISRLSMAAAAVFIPLIVIMNPAQDLYDLAEHYYQPESETVFESISNTSRSGAGSAMALFRQGDFKTAQSASFSAMQKNPDIEEIRLLYALTCFELDDESAAEANLHVIIQRDNEEVKETAYWYLALIMIRSEQAKDARPILEGFITESSPYSKKAEKLLKKLDKLKE